MHACTNCGEQILSEHRNYQYTESGVPNVILQGVTVADCPKCGNSDVSIPSVAKVHRTIARAIANSPARLTGPQVRFLRKHLGLNGDELGRYRHTDKTKVSKWETEEDGVGRATDINEELRPQVGAVAEHLPQILDESGTGWELHIDVDTLQVAFVSLSKAA